jgi:hypothetical protein
MQQQSQSRPGKRSPDYVTEKPALPARDRYAWKGRKSPKIEAL